MKRVLVLGLLIFWASSGFCEDAKNTINAAESDEDKSILKRNVYDGKHFTMRFGMNFMYDAAAYYQDSSSKKQMDQDNGHDLRDFRFLLNGRLKFAPRLSYSLGYMYDAPTEGWLFRQTGIMIDFKEWQGNLFIGRSKEGFSTSKVMSGINGWTNERATANDAFLPILADGVKWMGRGFENKFVYNVGVYNEKFGGYQGYDKNDQVFAARGVWLPNGLDDSKGVLHLALEARYGTSKDGFLHYRSRPEAFPAESYAIDTGKFKANSSTMGGIEAYYSPGPLMFGMEYLLNQVSSDSTNNPFFHGGEIFTVLLLTGETRPYNKQGAYFEAVAPESSVFSGGKGAWELVLRYTYTDLDSENIDGGKFWRITPQVNWHLSENTRLNFSYGYSELDRQGLDGSTQYLQTRMQFNFL